jgi:hypothetical protein
MEIQLKITDKPLLSLYVEKVNIGGNPYANVICRIESFPLPDEARLTIAGKSKAI